MKDSNKNGDLKKLVRNLRIKSNEKLIHIESAIIVRKGQESKKDKS